MDNIINKLKLKSRINLVFYMSLFLVASLMISFHLVSEKINSDLLKNINDLKHIHKYYNNINEKIATLNHSTIEYSLNINLDYDSSKLYQEILTNIQSLKNDDYLSESPNVIKEIKNMQTTIVGYKQIADSLKAEVKKDYENSLYNILALAIHNDTINEELNRLETEIEKISQEKSKKIHDFILDMRITMTMFIFTIFMFMIYINFKVQNSILCQLKSLQYGIVSFFDVLANKRKDILYMNTSTNDEISQIAKLINSSMADGKNILLSERENAQKIEESVIKATKEIQKLNNELEETQREIVFTMGIIGEERSQETGYHVMRVAEYSLILARLSGLSLEESILIKTASPMHDVGKIGIPDAILNKPTGYTQDEYEIMKTHAEIGYRMLGHSNKSVLKAASIVSYEHHEKWDGSGYPRGLKGEDIHIYGRITAIADVFDALGASRVYKKAWPIKDIYDFFEKESGKHFDPRLVELLLDNLEYFLAARENIESEEESISLSNFIQNFDRVDDYI